MADAEKKFTNAGSLKENSFVLIDGFPCVIKSVEKSKPGKHGAAKTRITAMGIFDNQKRGLLKPVDADVEVPIIEKGSGQIVAVMGDTVQVMDTTTYDTYNVPKPKEIQGLASGVEVEFQRYGNFIKIVRKKADK